MGKHITQQVIALSTFAEVMQERDAAFAARVRTFEVEYGAVDPQTLAMLAQATYFCWFEQEYARDYLEACRAIGAGTPTSLYLCCQVSPQRWRVLNSYVVGVQRWLGCATPIPTEMDAAKIAQIQAWLGEPNRAKTILATLFLHWFIRGLRHAGLSILAGDAYAAETYDDYSDWYHAVDGTLYGEQAMLDAMALQVTAEMGDGKEATELVTDLLRRSQPGCMHRYTRYQDIKLSSIGALRWRGAVPPDTDTPKMAAAAFLDRALADTQAWLNGEPPQHAYGEEIHRALGALTARKRSIVQAFFLAPKDDLSSAFFYWLAEKCGEHTAIL